MGKTSKTLEEEREYQRKLVAERNAAARDIKIPAIKSKKRRQICLACPRMFLKTYFDWIFYNPFTSYQGEMIDACVESIQYGTQNAVSAPRGDGKTNIAIALDIFGLVNSWIRFPVLLAATENDSQKILRNIKGLLTSTKFIEDFPEVGFPLLSLKQSGGQAQKQTAFGKQTEVVWGNVYVRLPNIDGSPCAGAYIMPLSIDGAIRGQNEIGERPDHGIIDDPETRQSASNPEICKYRLKIIETDFAGLGGGSGKFGMTALVTIMNSTCLAATITDRDKKPAWGGIRRGLIETWPTNKHLWDQYVEIRQACQRSGDKLAWEATLFYLRNFEEMNRGCKMNNPYRFNSRKSPAGNPIEVTALQACMNFIADKDLDSFLTEYQSDTIAFGQETKETEELLTAKVVESRTNGFEQNSIPENTLGITCGLDVGRRYCHWWKTAWASENRGFVIDYGVIEVYNFQEASVERSLKAALQDWQDSQSQSATPPDFTLIDTGDGTLTDALYSFVLECNEWPLIAACKGYGIGQGPRPTNFEVGTNQEGETLSGNHWWAKEQVHKGGVWLYHPDTNFWKKWLQERFQSTPFDSQGNQNPNTITIYRPSRIRAHQSLARHVVAEEWTKNKRTKVSSFVQVNSNNHWLDAGYMSCAAAEIMQFISSRDAAFQSV